MTRRSDTLLTGGGVAIVIALLGLASLATYRHFRTNDRDLARVRFETVLISDASFPARRGDYMIRFEHNGHRITGFVRNVYFVRPCATLDWLRTLHSGDAVTLAASETPGEANDVVDVAAITGQGREILTAEQTIGAREAADRRMLNMLLVLLGAGIVMVLGYRVYAGKWAPSDW